MRLTTAALELTARGQRFWSTGPSNTYQAPACQLETHPLFVL
jgi:hypothetical protein